MKVIGVRGLVLALLLAGCGGDDLDCPAVRMKGAPSGAALVASLSGEQRGQLCDFVACQNGGYGNQRSCASGPPVTFAASRDQCVSQTPTNPDCHATVEQLLACMDAIQASPCVSTFFGSSACEAVTEFECLTFKPNAAAWTISDEGLLHTGATSW